MRVTCAQGVVRGGLWVSLKLLEADGDTSWCPDACLPPVTQQHSGPDVAAVLT